MDFQFPRLPAQRRDFFKQASETYYEALRTDEATKDYLKSRGITGEVAQHFRLGVVAEPVDKVHEHMVGMLSIPYITPTGVTCLRFRRLTGNGNKYHNESGILVPIFNARDLHLPEPHIAVCEGELDTVIMSGEVGIPAVGLGGLGQWQKRGGFYVRLLGEYERVFVVMDPDDKGQEVADLITSALDNAVNVVLPADVNDMFLANGEDYIRGELGL